VSSQPSWAKKVQVAVASNFATAIGPLATLFETQSNHKLLVSLGSTGKHFAQITQGAPFDVFLSADSARPKALEDQGKTIGNRFNYATGELILLSYRSETEPLVGRLSNANFNLIAIANPKLSPFGRAAQQVLQKLYLWEKLSPKIVRGENINQAFQFVYTGNAQLGLIAKSQLQKISSASPDQYWIIPKTYYEPIIQQAVLLTDNSAAKEFTEFLQSPQAITIIKSLGYGAPYAR